MIRVTSSKLELKGQRRHSFLSIDLAELVECYLSRLADDVQWVEEELLGWQIDSPAWTHQMGTRGNPRPTLVLAHSVKEDN